MPASTIVTGQMKRWFGLLIGFLAIPAYACDTPVFEYALNRWPADDYDIIVFHRGGSGANAPLDEVRTAAGGANAAVRESDLVQGKLYEELLAHHPATSFPWMIVRYPSRQDRFGDVERADGEAPHIAWAGPAETNTAAQWLDSPARRELVRQLAAGSAVVWILLECGEKAQDDAAYSLLVRESERLSKTLEFPVGYANAAGAGMSLATLRVSRQDPKERALATMLQGMAPSATPPPAAPMVFPTYGKARVLPPLVGTGITAESIAKVAVFLTGACSCEVKASNPGTDLLVTADWDALLANRPTPKEDLPPLVSLSQLASDAGTPAPPPTLPEAAVPAHSRPLWRNLTIVLGTGIAVVVGIALWLSRKKGTS